MARMLHMTDIMFYFFSLKHFNYFKTFVIVNDPVIENFCHITQKLEPLDFLGFAWVG